MKIQSRHTLVSLVLLLCSLAIHAQNRGGPGSTNADSLKEVLVLQPPDTNKVLNLFRLSSYYRWRNPDSSFYYAHKALKLAEDLDYEGGIFWSLTAVCGASILAGDYPKELEYAFRALALSKKLNQPRMTGFANGMMSEYYYNLGEYETSLKHWRHVVRIIEKWFPYEEYVSWGNLSRIYGAMDLPDSAMVYARKALDKIREGQGMNQYWHPRQLALTYLCMADAFAGKSIYDSALIYYRSSLSLSENNEWEIHLIDNYNGIASVYRATNGLDSAEWYAKKVLSAKIAGSYPASTLKAANLLADVYELKNIPDSALKYVKVSGAMKENLFNREKIMAMQDIHYREQEKERELAESKSRLRERFIMITLLVVFIAALVIVVVVLRNSRQKHLQRMRNSIADDLHDDIGSTLSSINIMGELARRKAPEASVLLDSISESTISMQENMSDIVWAIKTENDRFENVLRRMNAFASEVLDAKGVGLNFSCDAALASSRLSMKQRKNMYLFFKEAINNAVRHANANEVSVSIVKKWHQLEMVIDDDGKGFDVEQAYRGNGMTTLRRRAEELGGTINIQSRLGEGTSVQLSFRI